MSLKSNIQTPIATLQQWTEINPVIPKGSIVAEVTYDAEGKLLTAVGKMGDGVSNYLDLPYLDSAGVYKDVETVNNPIGSWKSGDSLYGKTWQEVTKGLLRVYSPPSVSSLRIESLSTITLEIGTTFSGNKTLSWTTNNAANILANSGEFNQSHPVFDNPGSIEMLNYSKTLSVVSGGYKLNVPGTITLQLRCRGIDANNTFTAYAAAYLRFLSRAFWGSLQDESITTQQQIDSLQNSSLISTHKQDYSFTPGYPFVAIPEFFGNGAYDIVGVQYKMLDPITGQVQPFDYAIARQDLVKAGAPAFVEYNNGNTTYKLIILRAANYFNGDTRLRIQ